jgi:cation:H+ antiporter
MGELIFEAVRQVISLWPAVLFAIIAGVAGLKYGADWMVEGSSGLGVRFGMSPVMVGLILVAFGTSAPELVVSIMTANRGQPEISLGNVLGSNIANTTIILGLTAVIFPLAIKRTSYVRDAPIGFGAILLAMVLAWTGSGLSRLDGVILLVVFFSWLIWTFRGALATKEKMEDLLGDVPVSDQSKHTMITDLVLVIIGLVGLVIGADLLVAGAVATARALEVPDVVVGLTIVAGGTSLPELAVCLVAALNKKGEITVGNVLGSNIFNAMLILGVVSVLAPMSFDLTVGNFEGDHGTLFLDFPIVVAISAIVIPLMAYNQKLSRANGAFLAAIYVAYIAFLLWRELG